jgi:hypothetical protein
MSLSTEGRTEPVSGRFRIALWIAIGVFAVYLANLRLLAPGDSLPARYLPFAIWGEGSLTLDSVANVAQAHRNKPYWVLRSHEGHLVSLYPIVTPLLVTPFYAPAVAYLKLRGWNDDRLEMVGKWMEKLSAAAICAISAGLMFLLLARQLPVSRAVILTLGYALGTSTWSISSQALWLHGAAELLLAIGLLAVTAEPPWMIGAGLAAGLLIVNRPPDALLAGALIGSLFLRRERGAFRSILAATAILVPFTLYNLHFYHSVWGGYGVIGLARTTRSFYQHPWLSGVAGLLLSPAKGLFVFSPVLLLLAFARGAGHTSRDRLLALCLTAGILTQIVFYARTDWRAGWCYGPRFMADALPALFWLLAYSLRTVGKWAWRAAVGLIVVSIAIQIVGAFCYPRGRSDILFYPTMTWQEMPPALWSWRNPPFLVEARAGVAPPEMLDSLTGFLGHTLGLRR